MSTSGDVRAAGGPNGSHRFSFITSHTRGRCGCCVRGSGRVGELGIPCASSGCCGADGAPKAAWYPTAIESQKQYRNVVRHTCACFERRQL
eukprot:3948553-Prymnesium_polylepis.1